jgi:flagellin
MVQTAEGAIAAAQEMAQRILTLATQGANGTLGTSDRTSIQNEMKQLLTAIDSVGARTKFSSNSLLNNDARTGAGSDATAAAAPWAKTEEVAAAAAMRARVVIFFMCVLRGLV